MKTPASLSLSAFFAFASLTAVLPAAPFAFQDFEDAGFTAGAAPSGGNVTVLNASEGNSVLVKDSSTTPADTFGGVGNQSIYVYRGASATVLPIFQLGVPGYTTSASLTSGRLSFDLYLPTRPAWGWGSIEVQLGTLNPATAGSVRGSSVAAFQISTSADTSGGTISYFNNTSSGGSISASSAKALIGEKNTIEVAWDGVAKTYSISLNGTSVVSSAFTVNSIAGVSSLRFTTVGGTSYDIGYFIDNVSFSAIPEPGNVAALAGGLGGLAALVVRKRKGRR